MKRWRDEKGSALVMVMFMMLILTLLGVAVLSAAVGGARRTLTRENDIQSLQLTQKVLDESVASIAAQINAKTANPDFREADLGSALTGIVASLDPELNKEGVKTEDLANASGRLLARPQVKADLASGLQANTAYTITLRAGAIVNGVERTLTQQVKVNMYPDFLNYAFGSENNLILNGSPLIKGNIYAGNKLQVSQVAKYRYNNNNVWQSEPSLFPKMKTGSSGQLPLAYIQSLDQLVVSKSGGPYVSVNSSRNGTETGKRIKEALNIPLDQIKIKNKQKFIKIDVDQSVIDKLAEALKKSRKEVADNYGNLAGYLDQQSGIKIALPIKPPKPELIEPVPPAASAPDEDQKNYLKELRIYNEAKKAYEDALAKYESDLLAVQNKLRAMDTTLIYDDPRHGSTLTLDGGLLSDLGTEPGKKSGNWLIVKGDLIVNNTVSSTPLKIASNLLVTGNVTLAGPIDVDSTLFTLGKTTIQDASIHGIQDSSGNKEIVVISKGEVLLNRVDKFKAAADTLRGFFYTDSTAELYGVGTNFRLEGGFFAKDDLTVNSVIGDSKDGGSNIQFSPQIDPGEGIENSRFQVDYNNQVFEHQGISLPHVPQVSVTAGKIQLDSVNQ